MTSRRPRVVLQEEYIDTLSKIIEKDYYPELHNLRSDQEQDDFQIDPSLHLDEYQAKHISEDSNTFEMLQQEQIQAHRKEYAVCLN